MPTYVTAVRNIAFSNTQPIFYVSPTDELLVTWQGALTQVLILDEDGDMIGQQFSAPSVPFFALTLLSDGDVIGFQNNVARLNRYSPSGQLLDESTPIPGGVGRIIELANGNIMVSYTFEGDLRGQIYSPTLDTVGSSFVIGLDIDQGSTLTALTGGGFVVLRTDVNVIETLQVFDSNGTPVGPSVSRAGFAEADVEALPDGGYVFVGTRFMSDPANTPNVFLQTFNADGTARIAEMQIGVGAAKPAIMVLDNSLFVLAYQSGNGMVGQLVHSSGRALGDTFELSAILSPAFQAIDEDTFVSSRREDPSGPDEITYWQVDRPNILLGTANGETLSGGGAAERIMAGFGGDDIYQVDSAQDAVYEWAGEGNDTVLASLSYVLRAEADVELLATSNDTGTAALNLTGNEVAQTIGGNAGDNQLTGGGGGDTLIGLGGNDFYFVNHAADVVQEANGGGADRVFASLDYTLTAGAEVEMLTTDGNLNTNAINLTGNALAQGIYGNAGANTLNGGGGADSLVGFEGDDNYVIVDGRENVFESAGQGSDRIFAHVDYRLQAGASVEIITTDLHIGTAAIDLIGNELAQLIYGNAGDNQLTGGGGGDTLIGFGGNDFYFVGDARDVVVEAAAGGSDRIFASASHVLAAGSEVEILSTDFNPGTAAINLTGNALAQGIYGNAGANQLNGGGGADSLVGFGGDDWYFIVGGQENVFESAGGGSDRILAGVDYRLQAGAEVELITTDFNAGTAAIDLTGNEFSQAIYGNAGNNILDGGAGKDVLIGNGGADIFLFSTALNTAPGTAFAALAATANVDQIHGFAFDDKIGLDAARFGLTPGALAPGAFVTGTAAQDADDRIIYDPTTGALLFDADGNGAGAAQLFAYISGPFNLDSTFFAVI